MSFFKTRGLGGCLYLVSVPVTNGMTTKVQSQSSSILGRSASVAMIEFLKVRQATKISPCSWKVQSELDFKYR